MKNKIYDKFQLEDLISNKSEIKTPETKIKLYQTIRIEAYFRTTSERKGRKNLNSSTRVSLTIRTRHVSH